MTDWFALLTPLLVLPIILLFVFVGCALDRAGHSNLPILLRIGSGFETGVESIAITFTFDPKSGEMTATWAAGQSASDFDATLTLLGPLPANGYELTEYGVNALQLESEGDVKCECVVTKTATLEKATESSIAPKHADEELGGHFHLTRNGEAFDVDFVAGDG
jgi:hypothetical protein